MNSTRRRHWIALLFLAPNALGFVMFVLVPLLFSLILAFCDWNLLVWPPRFAGFQNFHEILFQDERFWYYLYNTIFLMLILPVCMAGSLGLAIALNRRIRGIAIYRTFFLLPTFVAGVALCLLWKWLLNTDFGLINMFISGAGDYLGIPLRGPDWLGSRALAKPAMMLMAFWTSVGGVNMILYLAGLQGISPELYESALMDGAGPWQQFRYITWPLLAPTTFFILTMGIIGGFQGGFEAAYIMTHGGPDGATTTISYYIYTNAYEYYRMGYASAIAWLLFVLVLGVTLINWRYSGRKGVF